MAHLIEIPEVERRAIIAAFEHDLDEAQRLLEVAELIGRRPGVLKACQHELFEDFFAPLLFSLDGLGPESATD